MPEAARLAAAGCGPGTVVVAGNRLPDRGVTAASGMVESSDGKYEMTRPGSRLRTYSMSKDIIWLALG